uniref:Dolichyl-diphosphooligosaccharide-protein glycosyltransferase subunit TMEM258 n=1 Tax=Panthera leo TaxID=9689 RepID=A0A8C8WFB4_PANLE
MELEAMSRYTSPVKLALFPHLTTVLLAASVFFTLWFFICKVTSPKCTLEFLISLVASLLMGFGVPFLLLWISMYI